jgi:hypothetical protein
MLHSTQSTASPSLSYIKVRREKQMKAGRGTGEYKKGLTEFYPYEISPDGPLFPTPRLAGQHTFVFVGDTR